MWSAVVTKQYKLHFIRLIACICHTHLIYSLISAMLITQGYDGNHRWRLKALDIDMIEINLTFEQITQRATIKVWHLQVLNPGITVIYFYTLFYTLHIDCKKTLLYYFIFFVHYSSYSVWRISKTRVDQTEVFTCMGMVMEDRDQRKLLYPVVC